MSPEQARGLHTDARSDCSASASCFTRCWPGLPRSAAARPQRPWARSFTMKRRELASVAAVPASLARIVRHCLAKAPEERFQNVRDLLFDLEGLPASAWTARPRALRWRVSRRGRLFALVFLLLVTLAATLGYPHRTTDDGGGSDGTGDSTDRPAPDRHAWHRGVSGDFTRRPAVAFTAGVNGRRQIFVRLLAGGSPARITNDESDHEFPRWSPDATSLVYFSPAGRNQAQGALWSIPALGGSPRRVIDSTGDADISRAGRLVSFRLADRDVQLVTAALDGSDVRVVLRASAGYHLHPRWSADAQWIAFQEGDGLRFDIFVIPARGGAPRKLTNDRDIIKGLAWLPDGAGLVYGSSRGSTVPYLPSRRAVGASTPRAVSCGRSPPTTPGTRSRRPRLRCDVGDAHADAVRHLEVSLSSGSASENVRRASR